MPIGKYTRKLPDSFYKLESGANNKLLTLLENGLQGVYGDSEAIYESLDLSKATGKTLDLYGEMFGQKRGQMNDEKYRFLIRTKIARNTAGSDYNSILNSLNMIFNAAPGEIIIEESEDPCVVNIVRLSIDSLVSAGFTPRQAMDMVETLLPACVKVGTYSVFEGTFEFSAIENEYDENAGFADIEQTIGGDLGMLLGEDDDIPLPL